MSKFFLTQTLEWNKRVLMEIWSIITQPRVKNKSIVGGNFKIISKLYKVFKNIRGFRKAKTNSFYKSGNCQLYTWVISLEYENSKYCKTNYKDRCYRNCRNYLYCFWHHFFERLTCKNLLNTSVYIHEIHLCCAQNIDK